MAKEDLEQGEENEEFTEEADVDLDDDSEDEETIEDDDSEDENNDSEDEDDDSNGSEEDEDDSDELVVTIDGEESSEDKEVRKAPKWVKDLRKANREQAKKIKELESKLNTGQESKPIVLGKKPTLEECDFDSTLYESKLSTWYEEKAKFDESQREKEAKAEEEKKLWQQTVNTYEEKKQSLKVVDYDDAEDTFSEIANKTQLGIIIQGAENPALVIYALGKNSKKAKELCQIKDPVKFSFAIAKLESSLKVSKRKVTTKPEKVVEGKQGVSGSVDKTLDRLRAEAEKTGDYTKVMAYKRKLKK